MEEVGGAEAAAATLVRRPRESERTRTWFGVIEVVSRMMSRIIGGTGEGMGEEEEPRDGWVGSGGGAGREEEGEGGIDRSEETERHVLSSVRNVSVSGNSRLNCDNRAERY